ncbi:hypothetical protein LX81_01743 [Palleronia aestuarii]|uniref:Uncharacterized protein n=1 Tax=Palleronia aestuarii TaxID=568105 RepID=A0A2W7NA43_9RHOB|nr:hypothetical protein [Palleronia aestuarii]PZX17111.1 hypothetical protein LX81_01743 [Palleronia aestuarii]
MTNPIRFALVLSALGLAGCVDDTDMSSAAPDLVSQGEMPRFCRGAAAEEFSARPMDVITLPAEPDQGMYTVPGQIDDLFFYCTFSAEGRLVGVDRA